MKRIVMLVLALLTVGAVSAVAGGGFGEGGVPLSSLNGNKGVANHSIGERSLKPHIINCQKLAFDVRNSLPVCNGGNPRPPYAAPGSGAAGANGADGAQGPAGPAGPAGKDGKDASCLKPVVLSEVQSEGSDDPCRGPRGYRGYTGPQGAPGDSYLKGAYYAVAYYDVGDTNAGAIATVACADPSDTAISGGVQVLGLDDGANSRNTPVSSSFPGRMDWSTNTPKPDRLDGWIIQFGGNAQTGDAPSDKAPLKEKVWALCVPGLEVPVVNTYTQSAD